MLTQVEVEEVYEGERDEDRGAWKRRQMAARLRIDIVHARTCMSGTYVRPVSQLAYRLYGVLQYCNYCETYALR